MSFEGGPKIEEVTGMPKAEKRKEKLFATYKPKEKDFIGDKELDREYNADEVRADLERVVRRRAKHEFEGSSLEMRIAKKQAEIFEVMIFDQSESAEWLGSDCFASLSSVYDDEMCGVDLIIEFEDSEKDEASPMIAVDVTSEVGYRLQDKIDHIKQGIATGEGGHVKYFESSKSCQRVGEVKHLPHLILGAEIDTVRELINLWVDDKKESKEKMKKHPVQFQILQELIEECNYFKNFAKENGRDDLVDAYKRAQNYLRDRFVQREAVIGSDPGYRDEFYNSMFGLIHHAEAQS